MGGGQIATHHCVFGEPITPIIRGCPPPHPRKFWTKNAGYKTGWWWYLLNAKWSQKGNANEQLVKGALGEQNWWDLVASASLQLSPERLGPCGSAAELQLCLGPMEKDPCCETIHSDIFAIDMYSQLILLYDFKCSAKSAWGMLDMPGEDSFVCCQPWDPHVILPLSSLSCLSLNYLYTGGVQLLLVTLVGLLPVSANASLAPEGHGCCLTVLVQASESAQTEFETYKTVKVHKL